MLLTADKYDKVVNLLVKSSLTTNDKSREATIDHAVKDYEVVNKQLKLEVCLPTYKNRKRGKDAWL